MTSPANKRNFPTIIAVQRSAHPYDACFYPALEELGTRIVNAPFSFTWLAKNLNAGEYVHLQHPSFCYAGAPTRHRQILMFIRFVIILLLVRARGGKLLWTAHNLMPHHRSAIPYIDWLGRKIVILLSDRIFAHGASAASDLARRFPAAKSKIVLIKHGHWIDYYPHDQTKQTARAKLRIPHDAHVFLFIGLCKEYKNLQGLIEAFRDLPGLSLLLIAGRFQQDNYRQRILAMSKGDERIKFYPNHIPDSDLQDFLAASDCVVLPYLKILTSGSAMLALSFGRPIVSVRLGCLKDWITDDVGLLYDPDKPGGLKCALDEVRKRHFAEERILAHARRFSWTESAIAFLKTLSPRNDGVIEARSRTV